MAEKNASKIVFDGRTLIDLTADSVTADKLISGTTAHDKSGNAITGTCTYDADTSDATAVAAEILSAKTAYVNGVKITGSMVNNGAVTGNINTKSEEYTIPIGYHDGSGKVAISVAEQAKLIASNIRQGVTILGVEGGMTGTEQVKAETKTVTPTANEQVVVPDGSQGYNYLAQVTVAGIPYAESDNAAGGKTITIG